MLGLIVNEVQVKEFSEAEIFKFFLHKFCKFAVGDAKWRHIIENNTYETTCIVLVRLFFYFDKF